MDIITVLTIDHNVCVVHAMFYVRINGDGLVFFVTL